MADDTEHVCPDCPAPPECPEGIPAWMATFADLVTLLLTFFVLLYAMSKTDESKFQSVAGSIRKAFAGNAMEIGETVQLGKSPDDSPSMIESQKPVEPFPIDLLTTDGILDKKELNRESDEDLDQMKDALAESGLQDSVNVYEMKEGVKAHLQDKFFFNTGSVETANKQEAEQLFKQVVTMMKGGKWSLFIEGYTEQGESLKGAKAISSYTLSFLRAEAIANELTKRGVSPKNITVVAYGDSRVKKNGINRKVELMVRRRDLDTKGKRVRSQ